jgi:hypothetical protein
LWIPFHAVTRLQLHDRKCVSGLRQVNGYLSVLTIPPPNTTNSYNISEILIFWFQIHSTNGQNSLHRKPIQADLLVEFNSNNSAPSIRCRYSRAWTLLVIETCQLLSISLSAVSISMFLVDCKHYLKLKEPPCAYSAHNHRWLALSFREQLTRFYHKERSSPRVATADRGSLMAPVLINVIWNEVPTMVEIAIFWFQIHSTNGQNSLHRKWRHVHKSRENAHEF